MSKLPKLLRVVRRALLTRAALHVGALAALGVGVLAMLVAWWMPAWPRWPAFALLLIGPIAGALMAWRRMPRDLDLVTFIDLRLGADQAVVTAYALNEPRSDFDQQTFSRAEQVLATAVPKRVRPRMLPPGREFWGWPLALLACGAAFLLPPPVQASHPPGRDHVQIPDA